MTGGLTAPRGRTTSRTGTTNSNLIFTANKRLSIDQSEEQPQAKEIPHPLTAWLPPPYPEHKTHLHPRGVLSSLSDSKNTPTVLSSQHAAGSSTNKADSDYNSLTHIRRLEDQENIDKMAEALYSTQLQQHQQQPEDHPNSKKRMRTDDENP